MIRKLDIEKHRGYPLQYIYSTRDYYDVIIDDQVDEISVKWIKKRCTQPIEKTFTSTLYTDYLEAPQAFGYFSEDKLIGIIETNHEVWANRLRITECLINDEHRQQGIGTKLMDAAQRHAKNVGARALILETQSCNMPAINFYRKYGFTYVGMDSICYGNHDVAKREVRLEMGLLLS